MKIGRKIYKWMYLQLPCKLNHIDREEIVRCIGGFTSDNVDFSIQFSASFGHIKIYVVGTIIFLQSLNLLLFQYKFYDLPVYFAIWRQ